MNALGKHLLGELIDCKVNLDSVSFIKETMEKAAIYSNATIVQSVFHEFSPYGISGVVVIAESHLTIHTWPELSYAAVDVFTCGDTVNPWKAIEYIKEALCAGETLIKEVKRGNIKQHALRTTTAAS